MVAKQQLQNEIITNPGLQIKHLHGGASGFIALFRKLKDSGTTQHHYKIPDIEQHLSEWITYDSYMSMNTFFTPKRLITNLKEIRTAFVDIDCYNSQFTAEQIEAQLRVDYFGVEVPTPNMIIHSGRGINLIWFLEPMSGLAVERWDKLQKAIFSKFESLGADKKATDASRVFRLAGSVNSKNNAVVHCEVLHDYKYEFMEIVEDYFPNIFKTVQKPKKAPKERVKSNRTLKYLRNEYTLMKARMNDIKSLVDIRNGKMEGCREYALFLYRYWALVDYGDKDKAIREMLKVNDMFNDPLPQREATADTKSAERYYDSTEPFKITNEKIIQWLSISSDEQKTLSTVISKVEKRRRNTEHQRNKRGSVTKEEYESNRKDQKASKIEQLRELREESPAATQRELAEMMKVSPMTINRLLKEIL